MVWRVEITPLAKRQLKQLDPQDTRRLLTFLHDLIEKAIDKMVINPETRTPDIGGTLSTTEFTKKLIENLK